MDHDDALEELELAAAEPGGIDRLMAGDTAAAQSVAAHLAGCPACVEELAWLRRDSVVIRDAIRSTAPPELRERTLAYVREYGRVPAGEAPATRSRPRMAQGPRRRLGWIAAAAAAAVVSVVATSVILEARFSDRLAQRDAAAQGLARVTMAAVGLGSERDVARVELLGTVSGNGAPPGGSLIYSPSSAELVVLASGLVEPPGELEYRCWVEVAGVRSGVGKMFFGGGLAYWAGKVDAVEGLPAGATFGVSLVDASGEAIETRPVLEGRAED